MDTYGLNIKGKMGLGFKRAYTVLAQTFYPTKNGFTFRKFTIWIKILPGVFSEKKIFFLESKD